MTDPVAEALAFVESVELPRFEGGFEAAESDLKPPDYAAGGEQSVAIGSQIAGFAESVPPDLREFISGAFLLAQLAATKAIGTGGTGAQWYDTYVATLGKLGWTAESADRSMRAVAGGSAEVHKEILSVLTLVLGPGAAAAASVIAVLKGLDAMDRDSPWITLFQRRSQRANANQFQISSASVEQGVPVVRLVGFELDANRAVTQVLFFRFGQSDATLRQFSQTMSVDEPLFRAAGPKIAARLGGHVAEEIAAIDI